MQTKASMKAGTARIVEELFTKSLVGDQLSDDDFYADAMESA